MRAVVVYESLWGNTAAIARAIAQGVGPGARALSTSEATPDALAGTDLLVAGAPVLGFALPTEAMRSGLGPHEKKAPTPPDLSAPSLRSWLDKLPAGTSRFAAFETRIWWSPGGATKAIEDGLSSKGYRSVATRERFIVTGTYGPLKDGELERAQAWGAQLAQAAEQAYGTQAATHQPESSQGVSA
jgi:flavodoxin